MSYIKLDLTDVANTVESLVKYKAALLDFFGEAITIASDKAMNTAQVGYGSAANVSRLPLEKGASTVSGGLNATGRSVVFLEFGAGDYTGYGNGGDTDNTFQSETGIPIEAGQYSAFDGTGEYVRNLELTGRGFWHFGGQVYRGVYPVRALYHASQEIHSELGDPRSQSYETARMGLDSIS